MGKLLSSSADSQKLSLTVKGALVTLPAVLIALFQALNIGITETEVMDLIKNINAVIGIAIAIIGSVRKMWLALKDSFGK